MENDQHSYDRWCGCVIASYTICFLLLAILIGCLSGCSPRIVEKIVEKEVIVHKDSVVYRDSIVRYPIPLEKDQAIVHIGDTSHRETSLAFSDAFVGNDGLLHHSLENKKGNIDIPVVIPTHYIYTGITQQKAETITLIKEIEKKLTWWQKFRIDSFWWLILLLTASLAYIFRKPLMGLLKLVL